MNHQWRSEQQRLGSETWTHAFYLSSAFMAAVDAAYEINFLYQVLLLKLSNNDSSHVKNFCSRESVRGFSGTVSRLSSTRRESYRSVSGCRVPYGPLISFGVVFEFPERSEKVVSYNVKAHPKNSGFRACSSKLRRHLVYGIAFRPLVRWSRVFPDLHTLDPV